MMLNRWKTERLGNLVTIQSGESPSSFTLLSRGTYPFIKVEDLNNCQKYQRSSRTFTEAVKICVNAGSIIFPKRGAAILNNKVRIAATPLYMDSNMMSLTPKKEYLDAEFLYYTIIFQKLHRIADTSTIPQINNKHIIPYSIDLPPLLEQQKIAKILCEWDYGIEGLQALIAAKTQYKRGLMQQLFAGRKRFPEFAGQQWRQVHLGDIFTERNEVGHTHLKLLSITAQKGVVKRDTLDKRDTSSEDKSKYLRILPGDIGYNTMRMWQGVSGLSVYEGIVSPAYTICVPTPQIDGKFASHLFKHTPVIHLFRRYSQGLVDDTLSLKFDAFSKIKILIPSVEEQRKIAAVLDSCDREIDLLQWQLAALKKQKQGLMQKLLTGQVRVKMNGETLSAE